MGIVLGVLGTLVILFLLWLWAMGTRRGERQMAVFRPWRYAHRGLHNIERKVPENSLLAFRYAIAGGFGILRRGCCGFCWVFTGRIRRLCRREA